MNFIRSITQSSFIGYSILNQHWSKGYATEATRLMIDIAFNDHKLHRVVAGIQPKNKSSIRVVKKIGFRYEGLSKRIVFLNNEWRDLRQYTLTKEEFE